jgi:hypothetical protein
MSDQYPVPRYAANIWVTGDVLWLGFPPLMEGGHGHSVQYPNTELGLSLALLAIRERSAGALSIGLRGSPTQYQVERSLVHDKNYNEVLRAMRKAKEKEMDPELASLMKEIGL